MATQVLSAEVNINVNRATDGLNKLSNSVKNTTAAVAKGSANAGAALTNLGRVASDLPFGFIAIQNNLDPLIQSFGSLSTQSGGAGGALKALGASLLGPAGLALGFSVVSSAVTIAIQKYGSLGNAIDALLGNTKALTEEEKKFADESQKSAVNIQKQLVEVESLVAIAKSDVSTKKEQADALNKLNQLIPDNIGVLNKLNLETQAGEAIIRKYIAALIDQAEAELLTNKAAELRVKLFERQKTLAADIAKEQQKFASSQQQLAAQSSGVAGALSGVSVVTQQVTGITKESTEAYKDHQKQLAEVEALMARIQQLTKGGLPLEVKTDKTKTAKTKKDIEESLNAAKVNLPIDTITLPSGLEIATGKTKSILKQLETQINTEAATQDFELVVPNLNLAFTPNVIAANIQTLTDQMNQAFSSLQMDVFAGLGQAIGQSIMEGIPFIQSAAKVIFNAVGDFVIKIGEALIQFGIVNDAFKAAMAAGLALPGAVAIAAGVAAIAAGNIIKSVPQFANGGVVNGPTMGVLGEANKSEAIIPLDRLEAMMSNNGGGGTLVTEISGDKLRLILDRTDRRQRRNF